MNSRLQSAALGSKLYSVNFPVHMQELEIIVGLFVGTRLYSLPVIKSSSGSVKANLMSFHLTPAEYGGSSPAYSSLYQHFPGT